MADAQEMSGTSNVQINASQKKKRKENITSMIFYSSKSDTDGEPEQAEKTFFAHFNVRCSSSSNSIPKPMPTFF
jgi:hypothetical protein